MTFSQGVTLQIAIMKYISFLALFFILMGCDPAYEVEYVIDNTSDYKIVIESEDNFENRDTSIISSHTKLVFYEDWGIGSNTESYLDALDFIPLKIINIHSIDHIEYNKDELDITNWNKYYHFSRGGTGEVVLFVRNEDFN